MIIIWMQFFSFSLRLFTIGNGLLLLLSYLVRIDGSTRDRRIVAILFYSLVLLIRSVWAFFLGGHCGVTNLPPPPLSHEKRILLFSSFVAVQWPHGIFRYVAIIISAVLSKYLLFLHCLTDRIGMHVKCWPLRFSQHRKVFFFLSVEYLWMSCWFTPLGSPPPH